MTEPRPDISGWWECHVCGREVNPRLFGEACPDCSHPKCDECKACRNPTPVPEERTSDHTSGRSRHGHRHRHRRHHANRNFATGAPPPSLVGWWHCCNCSREVNSAWYGYNCPDCGHQKCVYNCYFLG